MDTNRVYLENGMKAVKAYYQASVIEEYNDNPFIEALPALENKPQIIQKLAVNPTFRKEEIELEATYRLHIVQRLFKFYQPLPIHIEIWNMIMELIRQGYIARNPYNAEYIRSQHLITNMLTKNTFNLSAEHSFRTTASTAVLIGFSGMGKTTTVNRVLSNIPQVIVHNQYKGESFSQMQLSWLKLEAPHDASVKALCLQFFLKVDEIMGTNNYKTYIAQRLSTDTLLPLMGKVGQNVGLGLLVIDEVQHLIGSKLDKVMNYFVTLINSFGIPVLFIGTPAAYPIFQNELRLSRRLTGHGEVIWNNMQKDDVFKFFLESVWKYQLTRQYTELNQELMDIFHEETQGISDLIIKLFVGVQYEAIETGGEKITATLIKRVAKKKFRAMREMIEAIKSKNPYKIARYEDIKTINDQDHIEKEYKTTNIQRVQSKQNELPKKIDIKEEVRKETLKTKEKKIKKSYEEGDIRKIIIEAKDSNNNPHELLMNNECIDDMSRWEA